MMYVVTALAIFYCSTLSAQLSHCAFLTNQWRPNNCYWRMNQVWVIVTVCRLFTMVQSLLTNLMQSSPLLKIHTVHQLEPHTYTGS